MQRPLILSPLVLALSLHAGHAMALGFGKVSGTTALGYPLSFSVSLRLDAADALEPGCVAADVMVGDRPLHGDQVRARLVRVGSSGERRIRVTTTVAIDEPTLSVTVRAGCPAQITRSFVVFADPPHTLARAGDPETDAAADDVDVDVDVRATSPLASAVPEAPARAASRPGRPAPAERRDAAAAPAAAATPTASRRARAAPPPPPVARTPRSVLQLDPLEDEELSQPALRMSSELSVPREASGVGTAPVDPEAGQPVSGLARLKSLEASVQQLRDNELAKERALNAMQAQMQAAERERYANPVTYTLAGLCAALALGLAAVLWLRRRDRQQAEWWAAAAAAESGAEKPAVVPAAPEADTAKVSAPMPPAVLPPAPPPPLRAPARPVEAHVARNDASTDVVANEPRRPMSAEELIDLEQQVEFFVVLGQDDAAIDLLMGHVRSTSGVSPLPYLKLLEIYRRREEREPYERIRERFNRRFNAYAPEWGVDPETGLDLAGYPEVLQRVQGIWEMPSMAMELLDTQLFRRDAGPTFDVPAYRELLFLYGIARDLAERDLPSAGVDLLLPFGDDEVSPSISAVVSRLADDEANDLEVDRITLDLDVSTDQPPNLTVEIRPEPDLEPAPVPDDDGRVLDFHIDENDLPPRR
ncbi:FimV family protein [Rhizobacter sp. Root1221]|uniref:type IV pilus assembly protein FimV n=1 Tax=Rhizobacter sp. Root1221 TaxID=1736433 RepID=UPI0007010E88|nr:hypothetical protein [Rhizobacter sp. Root1221]KQW03015.1 hypothetical protein ASC87_01385 [Rhizobacter sp. Root1221]